MMSPSTDPTHVQPTAALAKIQGLPDRPARAAALREAARFVTDQERPALIELLITTALEVPTRQERLSAWLDRTVDSMRHIAARASRRGSVEPGASREDGSTGGGRDSGGLLHEIARVWDLVPEDLRRSVRAGREAAMVEAARSAARADNPAERRAAAILLRESPMVEALDVLADLLSDPESAVAAASDRAFLTAAERLIERIRAGESEPASSRVGDAIARALGGYERHRCRSPLSAVITFLDARTLAGGRGSMGAALHAWFSDASGEAFSALRTALVGNRTSVGRARAWEWLARPELSQAASDRLARCFRPEEHVETLGRMHLSARPSRRAAADRLASIARKAKGRSKADENAPSERGGASPRDAGGSRVVPRRKSAEADASRGSSAGEAASMMFPTASDVESLTPRLKWGLVRWIEFVRAPAPVRDELLASMLTDPQAGVRLSAVRAVSSRDLADYCFDEDAAVARSAMIRWSLAGVRVPGVTIDELHDVPHRRLLSKMVRSPHAFVRLAASQDLSRLVGDAGAGAMGRLAMRGRLHADPAAARSAILAMLDSREESERLDAVMLIRRLGVAAEFQGSLSAMFSPSGTGSVSHAQSAGDMIAPPARASAAADRESPSVGVSSATPTVDATATGDATAATEADRLASSAISAIAEIAPDAMSESSRRVLDAALVDSRERVRANAVEGIARAAEGSERDRRLDVLLELKSDRHHRVRANALRGLVRACAGDSTARHDPMIDPWPEVHAMLDDPRPMHRLGALWLCERTASAMGERDDVRRAILSSVERSVDVETDDRLARRAARTWRKLAELSPLVAAGGSVDATTSGADS